MDIAESIFIEKKARPLVEGGENRRARVSFDLLFFSFFPFFERERK